MARQGTPIEHDLTTRFPDELPPPIPWLEPDDLGTVHQMRTGRLVRVPEGWLYEPAEVAS